MASGNGLHGLDLAPAIGAEPPLWLWPGAAYVHVPFCAHRCSYCDFAIAVGMDHLGDRYLDALATEISTLREPRPMRTVFLGGGTPTYLSPRQLARLLSEVARWLPPALEFSIEANPGTLTPAKIGVLANHGVNRVSLGAQSFHTHLLRTLERDHVPDDVPRAVEWLRKQVAQISLDLIFGVPGETLVEWEADLQKAVDLQPDHISLYGLTYEKGTPLWKQRQRHELRPVSEEAELEMYSHAIDVLEANGFEHYEISNFARPGCRSRHNQTYWANESYFGFGVGAARYLQGRREMNVRDLRAYIQRLASGQPATFQSETLTPEERARETMALQLRRREGIGRQAFLEQTGHDLDALAGAAIVRHVELGLLHDDGAGVHLTRQGKYVADAVITNLLC